MNIKYKKAFKEILYIINKMTKEEKEKIPKDFIEFLKNNTDKEEECSEENFELSKEAKIILSILYREYLSKNEKENESFFKRKDLINVNGEETKEDTRLWYPVTTKRENIFKRIYRKIKRIFKKSIF